MPTFLLKTEPSEYAYANLVKDKKAAWTGVSNNAALAAIRTMKKGDHAFIYHTGDEKAIVGLAEVVSAPYADPAQPGTTADGQPKFAVVDLKPSKAAKTPLTLAQIKADARFKDFVLVKQSRLSVMPVPADLEKIIRTLTGL